MYTCIINSGVTRNTVTKLISVLVFKSIYNIIKMISDGDINKISTRTKVNNLKTNSKTTTMQIRCRLNLQYKILMS